MHFSICHPFQSEIICQRPPMYSSLFFSDLNSFFHTICIFHTIWIIYDSVIINVSIIIEIVLVISRSTGFVRIHVKLCPSASSGITSSCSAGFTKRSTRTFNVRKNKYTFTSSRNWLMIFVKITVWKVSWFTWETNETWISDIITFDSINFKTKNLSNMPSLTVFKAT